MWHVTGNHGSKSKVVWKKRFRLWRRNVKQRLPTIGQSEGVFCEKTGIKLAHSRVPHLLLIPAGWKKRRYESTLTQLSSMAKVHSSEGHQAELNGNVGIFALCFGVAARKEHFKSHILGRQLAHLLDWLDSWWVLHRTKWKQHTIAQNKPLSLPDVHKTQDVCVLGATFLLFVWSLFGAASRLKPYRWLGFCQQKNLHTLTHKRGTQFDWQQALKKKQVATSLCDPLPTKGEATNPETSHAVAKRPVKVVFLSAVF